MLRIIVKLAPSFFTVIAAGLLCACSSLTTNDTGNNLASEQNAPRPYTALSTRAPGYSIKRGSSVFVTNPIHTAVSQGLDIEPGTLDLVYGSVEQLIQKQGVTLSPLKPNSDYILRAYVVYGNEFGSSYFMQRFGVAPELAVDPKYHRASLVLVINNKAGSSVWRGTVQIYGDTNTDQAARKRQIQSSISALVRQLPIEE